MSLLSAGKRNIFIIKKYLQEMIKALEEDFLSLIPIKHNVKQENNNNINNNFVYKWNKQKEKKISKKRDKLNRTNDGKINFIKK